MLPTILPLIVRLFLSNTIVEKVWVLLPYLQSTKTRWPHGCSTISIWSLPTHSHTTIVSILQWNIRNFRTHKPFLQTAIDTDQSSIIALQETHSTPKQANSLANYHYLRFASTDHYDEEEELQSSPGEMCHTSKSNSPLILMLFQPKYSTLERASLFAHYISPRPNPQ